MNTDLGTAYGKDYTGLPAHMPDTEIKIWTRWKERALENSLRVWFDVGLGPGAPIPENTDPNIAKMWKRNTQRRADVIIEYPTSVAIVEIRYNANPNVVGRLLTYRRLWLADNPIPDKPVELLVVTDILDQDTLDTCEETGVNYLVI